ncbi:MAG: type II secretion system F family protein [Pseudorhodobacter sp.]|nr:type II secretion system F family protein [Pseudorhodobacter sp.]
MTAFTYRAVDGTGKAASGVVEAVSVAAARADLRGRGLLPVEVAAANPAVALPFRAAMPLSALVLVTRQMATLLQSGLRIEDALAVIAQGQPAQVAGLMMAVRTSVLEGRSFAAAIDLFPRAFSAFYRASVAAGEASGRLDQVMAHLANFVENRARNRQTVVLALLYPALLGLVSLGIIAALMTFVVPDITRVFITRGTALPFLTRTLIGVSAFLKDYGLIALLGIGALVALGFRWLKVPANGRWFDGLLARGRLSRKVVQRMNAAQFAGTLATLVQSRVPLIEALQAAAGVTPNRFIRARIVEIGDKVRQGMSLKRAMEEAAVFPAMLVAMVASGEASGNLGVALERAASDQQRDLDAWIKALVALVEPAILLIMGGLVMMMVLAILLPIVSMNSLVGL